MSLAQRAVYALRPRLTRVRLASEVASRSTTREPRLGRIADERHRLGKHGILTTLKPGASHHRQPLGLSPVTKVPKASRRARRDAGRADLRGLLAARKHTQPEIGATRGARTRGPVLRAFARTIKPRRRVARGKREPLISSCSHSTWALLEGRALVKRRVEPAGLKEYERGHRDSSVLGRGTIWDRAGKDADRDAAGATPPLAQRPAPVSSLRASSGFRSTRASVVIADAGIHRHGEPLL